MVFDVVLIVFVQENGLYSSFSFSFVLGIICVEYGLCLCDHQRHFAAVEAE